MNGDFKNHHTSTGANNELSDSDFWVECNVCKTQLKNWTGSTPCCGSIAWIIEHGKPTMDNKIKTLRTFFRVSNTAFEFQMAFSGHIVLSKMHQLVKLALVEIEKENPDLSLIDKLLAEMESTAEQTKPKPNFPTGGCIAKINSHMTGEVLPGWVQACAVGRVNNIKVLTFSDNILTLQQIKQP